MPYTRVLFVGTIREEARWCLSFLSEFTSPVERWSILGGGGGGGGGLASLLQSRFSRFPSVNGDQMKERIASWLRFRW